MRRQPIAVFIASGMMLLLILLLAQASMQGNASFGGVVLIGPIPIIFGSSPQMAMASALLATVLMALSLLWLLIWPRQMLHEEEAASERKAHEEKEQAEERAVQVKGGAVVMIGPIPIVFGSDRKTAMLMMIIALAIMGTWLMAALR